MNTGSVEAEIVAGYIRFSAPDGETRLRIDSIEKIVISEGQVFLWKNGGAEAQIPLRAFADDATRDAFIAELGGGAEGRPPLRPVITAP